MGSTSAAETNSAMSMVWVAISSSAFSSSGAKVTYRSFAISYPFTISSRSTFSPSFAQTYCCLRREPHFAWRRLNETVAADCVAG
jgi:hypothetical protein